MDVERIIVRILADTTAYFRHMAMAEAGLSRFANTAASINARTAAATQQVMATHERTTQAASLRFQQTQQVAAQRHAATMVRLQQRQANEVVAAQQQQTNALLRVDQNYQQRMQAAARQAGVGTGNLNRQLLGQLQTQARLQRSMGMSAARMVYQNELSDINQRFAGGGAQADLIRAAAIQAARDRRNFAMAGADEQLRARQAEIARMRQEGLTDLRQRQQAINEAHFLSARARLIQGTVVAGAAVGAVTLGLGAYATKLAADYERIAVAFEVMTGSASRGSQLLKDIQQLALETPFHTKELMVYAKELTAFGVITSDLVPTLRMLGDVASGTGGDMSRVVLAYGQVMTAGRLMGQELRQFTNAGIPVLEYLAKVKGMAPAQVQQMVHRGDVSAEDVTRAFVMMTSEGGRFAGMMDRINKETVSGRWENLTEKLQVNARDFALAAFQGLGLVNVLDDVTGGLVGVDKPAVAEFFRNLRGVVESVINAGRSMVDWVEAVSAGFDQWTERNQHWIAVSTGLLGTIRALATALFVLRIAVSVLYMLRVSLFLLTGVMAVYRAAVVVLIALNYAWATSTAAVWLAMSLGPIGLLAVVAAIAAAVALLSSQSFGQSFAAGWTDTKNTLLEGWEGLKAAFFNGDFESGFEIMWLGIKIGFKYFLTSLVGEFNKFMMGVMMDSFALTAKTYMRLMISLTPGGSPLLETAIAVLDTKVAQAKANHATKVEEDLNKWRGGWMAKDKARVEELSVQTRLNALLGGPGQSTTARNIHDLTKANGVGMRGGVPWPNGQPFPGAGEFIPFSGLPAPPHGAPINPESWMAGPFGRLVGVEDMYFKKWADVYYAVDKVTKLAAEKKFGTPEMEKAVGEMRVLRDELDQLSAVLSRTGNAADQVKQRFTIDTKAKDLVQDIMKSMEEGSTPMAEFNRHMQLLNKVMPAAPSSAAFGLMATEAQGIRSPDIFGIADPTLVARGRFQAYEKLRKAVSPDKEVFPPAQLYGSKDAQETINRAKRDQMSDTDRIVKTLTRGNYLMEEANKYEKRTTEILEEMNANGKFSVRFVDLGGGGGER